MIHLLPYLEEQINSKKTPEVIYMILQSITGSVKGALSVNAEFIGQVHPFDFRIVPNFKYKNSFLPIITGKITESDEGSTIDIVLRMHIFIRIFLTLWFGIVYFCFLCGIFALFAGEVTLVLALLGFIIFSQVLMRCGFYGPAKKAIKRLKELL